MKKFIVSMLCVGAMVACTKTAVVYEPTGEIGFAPVSKMATKTATAADVQGAATSTAFPKNYNIKVWSNFTTADAGNAEYSNTANTLYLDGVYFGQSTDNDLWWGVSEAKASGTSGNSHNPYYWPKTGSLFFAGVAPAKNADKVISYSFSNNSFSAESYTQPTALSDTEDLLLSDVEATGGKSYSANNVSMPFTHALSWLSFVVEGVYSTEDDNAVTPTVSYTVNSITINKVKTTAKLSKTEYDGDKVVPTWIFADNATTGDIEAYKDGFTVSVNQSSKEATAANILEGVAEMAYDGLFTFKNNEEYNNIVVIPQSLSDDVTLVLNVTQKQDGTEDLNYDIKIQLNTLTTTNSEKISAWGYSKHYIYKIQFNFNTTADAEILISPEVVEWTTVNVNAVSVN